MSGFTTTGITMFTGLESMPRCLLFWRSLTQWIGGLGILTLFLAVIRPGVSAHRLFGAESHKITVGRPVPGVAHTIRILWIIYAGFTAFIFIALVAARVSWFDSICHSFTVLSTGGFSPYDASIEHFRMIGHPHFILIEYVLLIGMLMGGTSFLVHYRVLKGNWKALFDNIEMKLWWGFIISFVGFICVERFLNTTPLSGPSSGGLHLLAETEQVIRNVLFQVVSIITTTGFATKEIGGGYFGPVAKQLFLIMMVIGGCVGSTGGGLKVLRIGLLFKLILREVFRLSEIYRTGALFFTWMTLLVVGGIVTAFLSRQGAYEAFSGMFSALGNIGPCYIPVEEMGRLHSGVKITYIFGMLAGRLEILPVLLIFSRRAWR
jgi:trk system potassium uptake protein TrkH